MGPAAGGARRSGLVEIPRPQRHRRVGERRTADRLRARQARALEDRGADRSFLAGSDPHADLSDGARQRRAARPRARSRDRARGLAPLDPEGAERTARRTQRSRVAFARDRRRSRLRVLPGFRAGRLQRRGQGAVAPAARTVQPVLRLRGVTDPGKRDRDPPCGSGQRIVPPRRGREVRQDPLQGRSSRRDFRVLDADGLSAQGRSDAGADSRVVSVVGLRRCRRAPRVVGPRAGVRDEIGGEPRRRHRLRQRLGDAAEPAGPADRHGALRRRPQAIRPQRQRTRGRGRDRRRWSDGQDAPEERGLPVLRSRSQRQPRRDKSGTCSAR